ncbi:hypothetical protein [Kordia sp.]|uniref:hypothetical protein n=1 Tax=Kordia sp. TaxID=1965332 RepID=UPI003B5ABFED
MQREINTENNQLHTTKAIGIATFIGGPLAAGYLIRENYKAIHQIQKGNTVLIISIIATILLFGSLLLIPENIIDKIPHIVIPAIYIGMIVFWTERTFGDIFKQHEENKYPFYSTWRAVGIGVVSLLLLVIAIFGAVYAFTDFEAENSYATKMEQFSKNEKETLLFYDHMDTESDFGLVIELNKKVIPKWKENIKIIHQADSIPNLPDELLEQNKKLLRYSELRLEAFELLKKAISQNTDKYNSELKFLHAEIDKQLDALEE